MEPLVFLRRILPPLPPAGMFGRQECYYAIGIKDGSIIQEPCGSLEDIVTKCFVFRDSGFDSYMALSSYSTPLLGRKQNNALAFKAVRCDIDAGKKNPDGTLKKDVYPDAAAGLTALCTATADIPPSIIVSSGMGLHVYWTFEETVEATKWNSVSTALLNKLRAGGLLVDAPKTTDIAAILRLPGTYHQKTGHTVKVIASQGDYKFDDFCRRVGADSSAVSPVIPAVSDDGFDTGPAPRKGSAEQVIKHCNQMLTMGTGSYQQWFYGMCVLRRFDDGLDWAHKLSALDARYDKAGTDKKYMDASEDMPVLCSTFQRDNPAGCNGCPYRGSIKSPVQLHVMSKNQSVSQPTTAQSVSQTNAATTTTTAQTSTIGDRLIIPSSFQYERIPINSSQFSVDDRGIVWHKTEKNNGEYEVRDVILCQSQLYYKHGVYQYADERPTRGHIFEVVHPNGRVENVRFDVDTDLNDVSKWFANANMFPTIGLRAGAPILKDFMNAYLQSVVHTVKAREVPTFNQFGWTTFADPEDKAVSHTGFVIGSGVITAKGVMDARLDDKIVTYGKKELTTKGTLEEWKKGINMYKTLKQPAAQLAVLMSFASPFLKYGIGEAQSAIYSLWSSQSGKGKSHVLRFASSIWGDPSQSFVSRMASVSLRGFKLGKFQNIPVFFDEMTDVSDNDMYGLAYTLTGGKEKDKMHSSGGQRIETGSWSTTSFTTANKSFKAVIARKAGDSDATVRRIMEYECDFEDYSNNPEVTRYIDACTATIEANYGIAGPELIYQILKHEDWLDTIHPQVVAWIAKHKFSNEERFMSSPLAIALIVGRWCVELGILDWDIDAIEKWVLEVFVPHNRNFTTEFMPNFKDMLANYLVDRQPNTLVVAGNRRTAMEKDPEERGLPDPFILSMPQREIYVRYEKRERRLIINRTDLTTWLRGINVSYQTFKKRMEAEEQVTLMEYARRMGGSISWMTDGNVNCVTIERSSLDKLGIATDIFEEEHTGENDAR